jgi:hypothetical protein
VNLKGWYRLAEDQPPPACPETMVKQMAECVELYVRAPPMGMALPYNFLHFKISNDMPTDSEMHTVVRRLKNRRATGATRMRAKHIKGWLDKIQRDEKAARETPSREGADPRGQLQVADLCQVDPNHLGMGGNPGADELDGYCPATKGWRQFLGDRPTQLLLEGSGENHGVPTGHH